MKVFKFGGASVKDAEAVKNVKEILSRYSGEPLCVVISAMGKTTNALEKLTEAWVNQDMVALELLGQLEEYHNSIAGSLIENGSKPLQSIFIELRKLLQVAPPEIHDAAYDSIVSFGELLSTALVSAYLNEQNMPNRLLDARRLVITDESYRNGRIQWEETTRKIVNAFTGEELSQNNLITITQGFIGSSLNGHPVTLGREGSDFSAAVFAYALDAQEMIIWKDVPGVLNADPRFFNDTVKLDQITYRDAIELAYFGASVIHPKTIQPLQNKSIPLYVKSFENPDEPGTVINNSAENHKQVPCYIFKPNQVLLSISAKDFSFIAEDGLHNIFGLLSHMGIRINLMQNSAISFSICIDDNPAKLHRVLTALGGDFSVKYNQGLELITIRYYNQKTIDKVVNKRKILLEQKSRLTVQLVVEGEKSGKKSKV
ncbi:MAG: aspartate kinase [Bacteroidales bacterium]|nr:aspartate kinase [Bacteroidales bacterium]